jgi:hypothetical protein
LRFSRLCPREPEEAGGRHSQGAASFLSCSLQASISSVRTLVEGRVQGEEQHRRFRAAAYLGDRWPLTSQRAIKEQSALAVPQSDSAESGQPICDDSGCDAGLYYHELMSVGKQVSSAGSQASGGKNAPWGDCTYRVCKCACPHPAVLTCFLSELHTLSVQLKTRFLTNMCFRQ